MELKTIFAQDTEGNVLAGADVYVYEPGTTNLVAGLQTAENAFRDNPFKSDNEGRIELRAPDGTYDVRIISGNKDRTIKNIQFFDYNSGNLFLDSLRTKGYGNVVIGENSVSGAGVRDAVNVARNINGLTDCHAFADKTVIDNVSDYGGYGTFDATTALRGDHLHNHVFSFQDRTDYQGGGTLQAQAGLLSRPKLTGTGTIEARYGVDIGDVNNSGGGSILSQIGVYIRNLANAANNVALNIAQSNGWAIYAGGGAPSYFKGQVRIGSATDQGATLTIQGSGVSAAVMAAHTTASNGYIGLAADKPLYLLQNAAYRLEISGSSSQHAVRPGADAAQPLGDLSRRWKGVFATEFNPGTTYVKWTSGAGSPEGAVSAPVGSMYTRTDGGPGTTLYVKESGTGNTGWEAK